MNFIDHSRVAAAAAAAIQQAAVAREVLGYLSNNSVAATSAIASLSAAADASLKLVETAAVMQVGDDEESFRHGAAAITAFAKAGADIALYCRAIDTGVYQDLIDAPVYYDAAVVAVNKGIDALVSAIAALEQGA